jgi:hypothetical protein
MGKNYKFELGGVTQWYNTCLACTGPGFDPQHHKKTKNKTATAKNSGETVNARYFEW